MKTTEIRKLNAEQIQKRVDELKKELFKLRFDLSKGQLENTAKIKNVKKTIARMKTVLSESAR